MLFFQKIFGRKNSIENILSSYQRAEEYKNTHIECYSTMLNDIQNHEEELLCTNNLIKLHEDMVPMIQEKIEIINDLNKKMRNRNDFDKHIASKISHRTIQYLHDNNYIETYLHFMCMITLLHTYGLKYNNGKNSIYIDKEIIASTTISSIFSNKDLVLKLANKSYKTYYDKILYAAKNNLSASELEIENSDFEIMIIAMIFQIKEKTGISEEQMKTFFMEGIDNLVQTLGSDKISRGLEHTLFNFIKRLGFDGGLNQIPSFSTIALSQAKRDMQDDSYLPTTDINLATGENFLYDSEAIYKKLKNENLYTGIFYGLTTSIRITKGVRFRAGALNIPKQKVEKLEDIDEGNIYITNKRVIFKGTKKSFSIHLNKLLSIEVSEYGLLIYKDGKENPYILGLPEEQYYVFGEIISELLN